MALPEAGQPTLDSDGGTGVVSGPEPYPDDIIL